jgi:prevent-host-death family protein
VPSLTATDAARRFSDVLDAVEHAGESYTITRHGRAVARLVPAARTTGAELLAFLERRRPDAGFASDVEAVRALLTLDERWPA